MIIRRFFLRFFLRHQRPNRTDSLVDCTDYMETPSMEMGSTRHFTRWNLALSRTRTIIIPAKTLQYQYNRRIKSWSNRVVYLPLVSFPSGGRVFQLSAGHFRSASTMSLQNQKKKRSSSLDPCHTTCKLQDHKIRSSTKKKSTNPTFQTPKQSNDSCQ